MTTVKASAGSCSELQLAEDDLLIVNVSTQPHTASKTDM